MVWIRCLMSLGFVLAISLAHAASEPLDDLARKPVPIVPSERLTVSTKDGAGTVPIIITRDWSHTQSDVTRAVIIIHGLTRDDLLPGENAAWEAHGAAQDAIIIAPQFLIQEDVDAFHLPNDVLRWGPHGWIRGNDARAPAPISSYAVLDAILAHLADRTLFPNLHAVVIAGHSAGGQFVQRYAAVGRGQAPLTTLGIPIRYVVANPSSYLYFSADRPVPNGACAKSDTWHYGMNGKLPPYIAPSTDAASVEKRYLAQDVFYLLGTADDDPNQKALDKTCAAEEQGATRFARGINYIAYLLARHSHGMKQTVMEVPGVGHSSYNMFGSSCGRAALFDEAGCTSQVPMADIPTLAADVK